MPLTSSHATQSQSTNQYSSSEDSDSNDNVPCPHLYPKLLEATYVVPDPVKKQKRKDQKERSKLTKKDEPTRKVESIQIRPSMGTRLDLQYKPESKKVEGQLVKYVPPKSKKQLREEKERRKKFDEYLNFCKYDVIQVPSATPEQTVEVKLKVPSPEPSSAKVFPRKPSVTPSQTYPEPPKKEDMDLWEPKSGIFLNETKKHGDIADYDSFALLYGRDKDILPVRKHIIIKGRKRKRKRRSFIEGEGEETSKRKKKRKKKSKSAKRISVESEKLLAEEKMLSEFLEQEGMEQEIEDMIGEMEGEDGDNILKEIEDLMTKRLRKKVSQTSKATSYQSKDLRSERGEGTDEETEIPWNRLVQKYRRDSEIAKHTAKKKKKLKKGTLERHSFTRLKQETLKAFYFGSKLGTMHQGDNHFQDSSRNRQGICMSVAAYCYSVLVHPNKWTEKIIDSILESGNDLFVESSKNLHIHENNRELLPEDLQKYCYVDDKKIRFIVSEPEITGMTRSDDKRVFNLTKGFTIFFHRHKAGIFQTKGVSIAVWKDKHYYFFDGKPRSKDMFPDPDMGAAAMAHFYDIPAFITILLDRSEIANSPYVIFPIEAYKIYDKDEVNIVESEIGISKRSNYNILDDKKAVIVGSFDLADKCFDFTRKKQALAMAVVCLVYTRITPPSAWQRRTIDKILIIGNQLYLECIECASVVELGVDNLPAIFTIGPYLVDVQIFVNRYTDLLIKKGKNQLKVGLEDFFTKNTNGVVQIGKYTIAVWKQRNMFYCFDPYSRNNEGLKCRDGGACVSMHVSLDSLVDMATQNFEEHNIMFIIHSLKVVKIHRDPVQSKLFPKNMNMNDYPMESFKKYKMTKSRLPATGKRVTVDRTQLAGRRLEYGEEYGPSLIEIGSNVYSLTMDEIPPMLEKTPIKEVIRKMIAAEDFVADLDSPSLSDTQIEPKQREPEEEEIGVVDLDAFELTQEEQEMQGAGEGAKEGSEEEEDEASTYDGSGDRNASFEELEKEMEKMAGGEEEGADDWYMAMANFTQVGSGSLRSKHSVEMNTMLSYRPFPEQPIYPTALRHRQALLKEKLKRTPEVFPWLDMMETPKVTQSEELRKESNFVDLPDGTQLIRGTKNMADLGGDLEFMAPFVCVMAITVAKKYASSSWSDSIVDYVLRCGAELYKASKVRYDQVAKLEIPKVSLGKTNFNVRVNYLFDTYMKRNILELALGKILFTRTDSGILVTPTYACAVFQKNCLYYLFDGFGNNEVGLSEGLKNKGTACFARFKTIRALVNRIMYNKSKREAHEKLEYTRFVISSCCVSLIKDEVEPKKKRKKKDTQKQAEDEQTKFAEAGEGMDDEFETAEEELDDDDTASLKKEPDNKVGYQRYKGIYTIAGSKGLQGRGSISEELKEDHFVSLCASLMLATFPIQKWDTRRVDKVIDQGKHVYSHADDLDCSDRRLIKNILIEKNYFDIIVKRIKIINWKDNKDLRTGIDTMLRKKHNLFIIQFPNASYVFYKTEENCFHIFDPYGSTKDGKPAKGGTKANWIRFRNLKKLKRYLLRSVVEGGESYKFYNFEVTNIKKAPKKVLIEQKLQEYELVKPKKPEVIDKPFYEDMSWLEMEPIPWSRRNTFSASGQPRSSEEVMWHDWIIEYPKDLYSLEGTLHQRSTKFSPETRNKQTLANLVVAIGMLDIYSLADWTSAIIDSVLVNGDNYFKECAKDIKDDDYEFAVEDLIEDCSIFPYTFKITYTPVINGTMFLTSLNQFNLYKALRYFFENYEFRCGIIIARKDEIKRQVAFGKVKQSEYFIFDCQAWGAPMFLNNKGVAYALRTTTLNRLLHVLVMTLRGGDFFIFEIETTDFQPIN